MEMQITIRMGEATSVTVRSDDQRELIEAAAFFQELPKACPVCKAPVVFTARHPQSFNYYGLRCTGRPSHETTFGVKKEGGSLFYKASEPWAAWQPGARPDAEPEQEVEPQPPARPQRAEPRAAARPRAAAPAFTR